MPRIQLTGCMSSVVSAVEVHALFNSASLDVPITRMPTFGILFELQLSLYARQVSSESSPSLWFTFSWILPPDVHRNTHIHSDTYTTDIIGAHASFNKGRPRLPQTHCFWHTTATARRERETDSSVPLLWCYSRMRSDSVCSKCYRTSPAAVSSRTQKLFQNPA